ncbi:hypothetical protein RGF97_31450 [Streptomyces roseicoloratus]|uniref:Lipoprotein n=1 Tax=Streptomyces roseicoloratus TaxID=2508722 RepID=A0ABY9S4G6_9ACTN|nr:hypothetical protein [Streptomyces roseicoloratus]WMX49157.1 hypothetical protein RGF97_31450 [Streptomyces roseicoloratus]
MLSGAVVLSTTACSPIERPLAAVYVDGRGVPQALLRSCDADGRVRAPRLHGVAVRTTETEDGTRPEASGTEDDTRNDTGNDTANATGNDWIGWESSGMHKAADFPSSPRPPTGRPRPGDHRACSRGTGTTSGSATPMTPMSTPVRCGSTPIGSHGSRPAGF